MDRSRKANREDNEVTLQHKSEQDALLLEKSAEDKLAQLEASIDRLRQSSDGNELLRKRIKSFGECKRIETENSGQFYARLRNWIERELPQTKSPLHPPRQIDG